MTERVDFSRNAPVYDRRHGALLSGHVVDRLRDAAGLPSDARILDVGAGTGRVAIPFASGGYSVVALDPACAMLASLRSKAGDRRVPVVAADGTQLPFAAHSFDAVLVARLVYLVPEWRRMLLEALRVVRPGGTVLHEWGNGDCNDDWVQIREKARTIFEEAGVHDPFHPGARTEAEVDSFLAEHGVRPVSEVACGPDAPVTMREFLGRIESGECSYTWKLSPHLQARCLPALLEWAQARFDLDRPISSRIAWKVFQTPASGLSGRELSR